MPCFNVPGDLKLTADGRDLVLVDRLARIKQAITIGSQIFRGYWRYDADAGIPYLETIFVKGADVPDVRAAMVAFLVSVEGVVEVLAMKVDVDPETRLAVVEYTVRCDDGGVLTGNLYYEVQSK